LGEILAATNKFGVAPATQGKVLFAVQAISTVAFARVLNSSVVNSDVATSTGVQPASNAPT
jgi:hypothetical protein